MLWKSSVTHAFPRRSRFSVGASAITVPYFAPNLLPFGQEKFCRRLD